MIWVLLLFAGWLAATLSGSAGFGGALLLLPVVTYAVGPKAAVPVLTIAQLLGNLSRAEFGYKEICWRPVLLFSVGAIPVSILGARLFVSLPPQLVARSIGVFLLCMVAFRHTKWGKKSVPEKALAPAGALVGFLSAVAGSAGPLGAAIFLGLNLSPTSYVASEAVTAVFMHLTKTIVYGKYALLDSKTCVFGLALGTSMVVGSWSGRQLIARLPKERFVTFTEALLVVSALLLMVS